MEWIKVEKCTPDKPAIRAVARVCGCSLGDAFLAWFRLWACFDGLTPDGWLPGIFRQDCDDVARLPGIAEALAGVGWLEFHDEGTMAVGWDRHNGQSSKAREQSLRRVQAHRARKNRPSPGSRGGL